MLEIKNAELIMPFRNFSGRPSKFNAQGTRSFAVYLPEDTAEQLAADGWTVKVSRYHDQERPYLSVTVRFDIFPATILCGSDPTKMKKMDENTVGELDFADIDSVDLAIRPRPYDVNGKKGIKAYLAEMAVIINQSSFMNDYKIDDGTDEPF